MGPLRMFTTFYARGKRNYINSQKKYEVIRTVIFFAIPISLFIAGYVATGSRYNLLTVVAVLGCLPASRSVVSTIMFMRFKSCSDEVADRVWWHCRELGFLYDNVFTTSKRDYFVSHMAVRANYIVGFSEDKNFPKEEFCRHVLHLLEIRRIKDVNVTMYTDLNQYEKCLKQLNKIPEDVQQTAMLMQVLMDGCL